MHPTLEPLLGDFEVCPPVQIGDPARPHYSYSWAPAGDLNDPTLAQPTALATGNYTVTMTDTLTGCTLENDYTVFGCDLPPDTFTCDNNPVFEICDFGKDGETIGIGNDADFSYAWTSIGTISNATSPFIFVNPSTPTSYTLERYHIASGVTCTDAFFVDVPEQSMFF